MDEREKERKPKKKLPYREVASRDRGAGVEQVAERVDVVAGRADGDDDWRERKRKREEEKKQRRSGLRERERER